MKEIMLTQGKVALVDDEDFDELSKYKWYANKDHTWDRYYVNRRCSMYSFISMHRQILNIKNPKIMIDHIDHNALNNQKSNLRVCTNSQNQHNANPRTGTSKFKGISWDKGTGKWRASIICNKKKFYIGIYDSEIEAAKAYDAKAKELFREFAWVNIKESEADHDR